MSSMNLMQTLSRGMLKLRKQSPHLLMGVGISAGIGCVVMACKQTLRAHEVIEAHEEMISAIDEAVLKEEEGTSSVSYTESDRKKDLFITYTQTGLKFLKLYWVPLLLGVVSVGALIGSHGIMVKRNIALVAAYKGLEEAFKKYRYKVVGEFGADKDLEYMSGSKKGETTEDGHDTLIKLATEEVEGNGLYMAVFDSRCKEWEDTPMYNITKLHLVEQHMNQKLRWQGHVFLNEVYDALGMDRTKEGSIVGWILDRTPGEADGYIDFNIHEYVQDGHDGKLKNTDEFYLEFNVDGIIFDRI